MGLNAKIVSIIKKDGITDNLVNQLTAKIRNACLYPYVILLLHGDNNEMLIKIRHTMQKSMKKVIYLFLNLIAFLLQ